MCLFLRWDFEYRLKCPVDETARAVTVQAHPQPHGHFLDIVACSAAPSVDKLACGKLCRDAIENGEYWSESG